MDEAARHISHIVGECQANNISVIETSKAAEDEWVEEILRLSRFNEDFQAACTPGYYNNEGKPNPKSAQNGPYGKGPNKYFAITKQWREEGGFPGMEWR